MIDDDRLKIEELVNVLQLIADGKYIPFRTVWCRDNGQPFILGCGLCQVILEIVGRFQHSRFFSGWEHYSGCDAYPVPSHIPGADSHEIYMDRVSSGLPGDMYTGAYGKLRRNLAGHLAREYAKLL